MAMRILFITSALLVSGAVERAYAHEIHAPHCLFGCPLGGPTSNDLIVREIYVLSSNDLTKFADWAAYKVTAGSIGPTQRRRWKADPLIDPSETLEPNDYRRANAVLGTDRGHQVPLASFTGTPRWRDTNYLSNITPQMAALNQGPWLRLESRVRNLARARGNRGVFVLTGPLYERVVAPLPGADEQHSVPSGYWKIVAVVEGSTVSIAAFVFDQLTPRGADVCAHIKTVREIERRSRLDFFHALSRVRQDRLETGPATLRAKLGC